MMTVWIVSHRTSVYKSLSPADKLKWCSLTVSSVHSFFAVKVRIPWVVVHALRLRTTRTRTKGNFYLLSICRFASGDANRRRVVLARSAEGGGTGVEWRECIELILTSNKTGDGR